MESKRRFFAAFALACSMSMGVANAQATPSLPRAPASPSYTDITGHWAEQAIRTTTTTNDWLRLSGTRFSPDAELRRSVLAYALVRTFARTDVPDPRITFSDVAKTSRLYWYANIAVKKGLLSKVGTGFAPAGTVNKTPLAVALVRTLRLFPALSGINRISDGSGYLLKHSSALGYHTIAHLMRFSFNYPNASGRELFPATLVRRGDLAHALVNATNAGWRRHFLERFRSIKLPVLTPARRAVVEFALKQVGLPYHYAGTSATTGYDCSGFVWSVLRAGSGPGSRGYAGWSLPQRSSYDMARATTTKIWGTGLQPLDLLFWDTDGAFTRDWRSVGHAGIYLGNGWFIHSSGGRAGVTIDWMGDGYWQERLVWARRIVPSNV